MNDVKGEMLSITKLATNASLNAKGETPNITNLPTTTALTAVENKIPNVSTLVKKLTITQKLGKLKIKLLPIIIMINKLTSENVTARRK